MERNSTTNYQLPTTNYHYYFVRFKQKSFHRKLIHNILFFSSQLRLGLHLYNYW
ncbi:MAG: hypothetical protein AAF630_17070 [Cyanobacteria bacterium P01_C01_bin.38]